MAKSRRRCCICYGLSRDTTLKAGQIAHLDHDNSNNDETNLVFLCFEHHDQYDSTIRQSKNLTQGEVKRFRDELYSDIQGAFRQPVFFGSVKADLTLTIEGSYTRVQGNSAEIRLTALPVSPDRFHVSGFALWGEDRNFGPNMGELDFTANLVGGKIEFIGLDFRPDYKITIYVSEDQLRVEEENYLGVHGMNVTFNGDYIKGTALSNVGVSNPT